MEDAYCNTCLGRSHTRSAWRPREGSCSETRCWHTGSALLMTPGRSSPKAPAGLPHPLPSWEEGEHSSMFHSLLLQPGEMNIRRAIVVSKILPQPCWSGLIRILLAENKQTKSNSKTKQYTNVSQQELSLSCIGKSVASLPCLLLCRWQIAARYLNSILAGSNCLLPVFLSFWLAEQSNIALLAQITPTWTR